LTDLFITSSTVKDWSFNTLPLFLFVLFFLSDPLLLNPIDYGALALSTGAIALVYWILDARVNGTVLKVGSVIFCITLLSAVFSGYFWNSMEYSVVVGSAVLLLSMVHSNNQPSLRDPIPVLIILLGFIFLLGIVVEYWYQIRLFGWYGTARLPLGDFRNPNVLGRFFGLVTIVCVCSRGNNWLRYGFASSFIVALLMTGSRGAILALVLALAYYLLQGKPDLLSSRYLLVGGVIFTLLVLVTIIGWPTYVTNLQRINLAAESLVMTESNPWLGIGGWNFGLVYPSVSFDGHWQRHAHALPFQILAEFGLIGFSVGVVTVLFLLNSDLRDRWIPVLVFLGFHELVDTMIWIPGITILGLLALKPLRPTASGTRRSQLIAVMGAVVLIGGTLVWNVGPSLRHNHLKSSVESRDGLNLLATSAAFPVFHGIVRQVRDDREVDLSEHAQVLQFNQYDPYYFWFTATVLFDRGHHGLGQSAHERYVKMDPHGMLGLTHFNKNDRGQSDGIPDTNRSEKEIFIRIIEQPNNPERYLPVILRTLKQKNYGRALEQIQYIAGFPKVDRAVMNSLETLRSRLPTRLITRGDISDMSDGTTPLPKVIRQQFHRFFYRRPGNDYVTVR
jgi:hypothetical protein